MAVPSFEARTPGLTSPARGGEEVSIESPGVDVTLSRTSRALWIGGDGDLTVTMMDGQELTLPNVPGGMWIPCQVTIVHGSTTCTGIVALW